MAPRDVNGRSWPVLAIIILKAYTFNAYFLGRTLKQDYQRATWRMAFGMEREFSMLSIDENEYISFCRCGMSSALIFSIILSLLVCCNFTASRGRTRANSNQPLEGGQVTQNEAERSALAEFAKHAPHTMVESYVFEVSVRLPNE